MLAPLMPKATAVWLVENTSLTFDQIADSLNRPVGTVKTQMRSALQKLRKILCGQG